MLFGTIQEMQTSFSVVRMNGNMEVYEYRDTLLWGSADLERGQGMTPRIHYTEL